MLPTSYKKFYLTDVILGYVNEGISSVATSSSRNMMGDPDMESHFLFDVLLPMSHAGSVVMSFRLLEDVQLDQVS